jgi:hypothetical protein
LEKRKIPQKNSPHHSNAVHEHIVETMKMYPEDRVLLGHVDAIAKELGHRDAFEYVDGGWVLPVYQWEDWLRRGDDKKYKQLGLH